jgi:hypothetical protein
MDMPVELEHIDVLLAQHRVVLEYGCLVDSQQSSVIEEAFPNGPPECSCLVCRQFEALSDGLVILAHNMRRYEKEFHAANPNLEATVTEPIDIASFRCNLDADGY